MYVRLTLSLLICNDWCWKCHCCWWKISANENVADEFTCNAECGTTRDRRFSCWVNIVACTTAEEELAIIVLTAWKDFSFSCLKKWMTSTSVSCPDYVSKKWRNHCEWRNWFRSFTQAKSAIWIWSTTKDLTFTADTEAVIKRAWQTDDFLTWKLDNCWKTEGAASFLNEWWEDKFILSIILIKI